mmetsp:Transcript_67932/g.196731  ORF Transcript_67932/g.196731 Transcript_67932/m.196731 type:complete len:263 (+) Transcript_67932:218-1006(+)
MAMTRRAAQRTSCRDSRSSLLAARHGRLPVPCATPQLAEEATQFGSRRPPRRLRQRSCGTRTVHGCPGGSVATPRNLWPLMSSRRMCAGPAVPAPSETHSCDLTENDRHHRRVRLPRAAPQPPQTARRPPMATAAALRGHLHQPLPWRSSRWAQRLRSQCVRRPLLWVALPPPVRAPPLPPAAAARRRHRLGASSSTGRRFPSRRPERRHSSCSLPQRPRRPRMSGSTLSRRSRQAAWSAGIFRPTPRPPTSPRTPRPPTSR